VWRENWGFALRNGPEYVIRINPEGQEIFKDYRGINLVHIKGRTDNLEAYEMGGTTAVFDKSDLNTPIAEFNSGIIRYIQSNTKNRIEIITTDNTTHEFRDEDAPRLLAEAKAARELKEDPHRILEPTEVEDASEQLLERELSDNMPE